MTVLYRVKPACIGHLVYSIQFNLTEVTNLWQPCWTVKIELCDYNLCKYTGQSAETGGRVVKHVHNHVSEQGCEVHECVSCYQGISVSFPYLWRKGGG